VDRGDWLSGESHKPVHQAETQRLPESAFTQELHHKRRTAPGMASHFPSSALPQPLLDRATNRSVSAPTMPSLKRKSQVADQVEVGEREDGPLRAATRYSARRSRGGVASCMSEYAEGRVTSPEALWPSGANNFPIQMLPSSPLALEARHIRGSGITQEPVRRTLARPTEGRWLMRAELEPEPPVVCVAFALTRESHPDLHTEC
jgi:hypothetical protein